MNEFDPSLIVSTLGGGGAGALILWFIQRWIHRSDDTQKTVDDHKTEIAKILLKLDQSILDMTQIKAALVKMDEKREVDFKALVKVESKVDAAWRAIESMRGKV